MMNLIETDFSEIFEIYTFTNCKNISEVFGIAIDQNSLHNMLTVRIDWQLVMSSSIRVVHSMFNQ